MNRLPLPVQTFGLRVLSNLFMSMAGYGHLKNRAGKPCTSTSGRRHLHA